MGASSTDVGPGVFSRRKELEGVFGELVQDGFFIGHELLSKYGRGWVYWSRPYSSFQSDELEDISDATRCGEPQWDKTARALESIHV